MTHKQRSERHQITTPVAKVATFADGIFTFAAIFLVILAIFALAQGDRDAFYQRLTLGLLFWIASTQLQPYWDRFCPTRCAHQPEDPDTTLYVED